MKARHALIVSGVAFLIALPVLLSQGLLNASIQMLIAALFASAYALLCGQAGMLSFGHAAYFGVGAFATVHAMNFLGAGGLLPTPLLPLAGAVVGLIVGFIAGFFATQRTGTIFAMITLAIAELLHSLAPHLKGLFGGEAGLSTMRMPAWGLTFGSTTQVYYLTLSWVLVSVALLYLYTLTPIGRLTLGLRENSHRLRFLGYNVHALAMTVFAISAMFSGIAGGLQVVSNEAANYVVFDPSLSATVVLNSYIGGVGVFLGPTLGAALMTFFGYAVSDLTQSWLLYQGVLFVIVMMFIPSGLTGLFGTASRLRQRVGIVSLLPVAVLCMVAALSLTGGLVFATEMLQRVFSQDYRAIASLNPAGELPLISLFGRSWSPTSAITPLVPLALLAIGGTSAYLARRRLTAIAQHQSESADPQGPQGPQASGERGTS